MAEVLISIDVSQVREGKLEELREAIRDLAEFVDTNEPRPIAYHVYLDDAGEWMTVLQIHPDPASMELHMEVAASAFAGFSELLTLARIDVYGEPSDRLLEQLGAKASLLGNATLSVHRFHSGFTRLGPLPHEAPS